MCCYNDHLLIDTLLPSPVVKIKGKRCWYLSLSLPHFLTMTAHGDYRPMSNMEEISDFHQWDADRLGLFFRHKGLGEYAKVLKEHKITGYLAPLLSDDDLKEMGIHIVGDRLMFKNHLKELSRRERFLRRIEAHWEGQERLFVSDCERNCWTLGGLCPVDPSTYRLTANHLKVRKVVPCRLGPVRLSCCWGSTYLSHNIDLSKVDDVDVTGIPASCIQRVFCCAKGKDLLEIESRFERSAGHGKVTLVLPGGQGEAVATLILNQIEESQKMERT